VLGLGYPRPNLGLFREDSERLSPHAAAQGVLKWPSRDGRRLATLIDEFSMPLPDAAVDPRAAGAMRWKCPTIRSGCCEGLCAGAGALGTPDRR